MTTLEIKRALGLPDNTDTKRIPAHALRSLCAGGTELLDAKEWAAGIAGRSRDAAARKVGEEALHRLTLVQLAMLAALESARSIPAGELTDILGR